ncbi:hypothetical protein KIF59_08395 [Enterobacter cloacae subsp. cloacae]|nr:hypothetical protein [Enterobacter cloacae subsp. cloacae]
MDAGIIDAMAENMRPHHDHGRFGGEILPGVAGWAHTLAVYLCWCR